MNTHKIKRGLSGLILLCLIAGLFSTAALADSGTVKADALNVRSEASTSSPVIGTVYQGAKLNITATQDGWYQIDYNGKSGWVSADYVKLSEESGTGTITGNGVRVRSGASTSAKILANLDKGTTLTVTGSDGNWYQVSYNGQTAYVSKDYLSLGGSSSSSSGSSSSSSSGKTGTVNATYVRFRAGASTGSNILATFDKGATVTVNGSEGDWYRISYNGRDGYIYKTYLTVDGESSSSSSSSSSGKTGTVNATYVRFRAGASTNSGILATFDKGATVTVNGSEGDWYRISYNGRDGYIYKTYLTVGGESSSSSSSVSSASGTGTIRGTYVRVRGGASTSSSILATVHTGTKMDITGTTGDWYQVSYNGQTGYVYKSYLLTEEEAAAISSGSTSAGEALAAAAQQYLGVPYVYGGTSPSGFDCSGLVYYVYKQCGYSIFRTASAQYENGVYVDRSNLQPGDIIIFYNSGMTAIGHAGMYIGGGQFIHASSGGGKVQINNLTDSYYNTHYYGARRVV